MQDFEKLLSSNNLRITKPRKVIFEVLKNTSKPMAISEIIKKSGAIDRASVYRTLELFIDLKIVDIIPVGWKKRYELAGKFRPHHHHFHCDKCSQTAPLNSPHLEKLIADIAKTNSYQVTDHHFELFGICSNCQDLRNLIFKTSPNHTKSEVQPDPLLPGAKSSGGAQRYGEREF